MAGRLDDHSLIQALRETVRQANSDIYGLERAAKTLVSSPAQVASLLEACISDSVLWHSITDRAYCHANGFAKFALYGPAGSGFRLRLHVWTGEDTQQRLQDDQNVHGHRWNFGSAVIAGPGLDIAEFAASEPGGELYRSYNYRSGPAADSHRGAELSVEGDELEPVGWARLRRSLTYRQGTYGTSSCHVDTLHTVRTLPGEPTATLVVQGPTLRPHAPVYRRPDQPPQAGPQPMDRAWAHQVIAGVITAVRAGAQ
jgi:hypothetical protein